MSNKTSLTAQPLAPDDDKAWEQLASSYGTVFDSLRWTALFDPDIKRIGLYDPGGRLRGGFCLYTQKRLGLRILRNPPFTPQTGPFFESRAKNPAAKTNEQRAVVEAMAEHLAKSRAAVISVSLSFQTTDSLPFYWRGFKVVPQYTYRIDLTQDVADLFAAMSMQQRHHIRKAKKDRVSSEEVLDTSDLRSLVLKTFCRQDKSFPSKNMDDILQQYHPGKNSFCFISCYQGSPAAGVFVVHDSKTAWNLMTGYDNNNTHHGAGPLAMNCAIQKAKALGLEVFDFEGSVIPPIERYFRGFGGQLTPVFGVNKAWLPIEMGLKLLKRQKF